MSATKNLPALAEQWRQWLERDALPLWSGAGFCTRRKLYHERLDWAGGPVEVEGLRLMVQARQIATFCRAKKDGFFDAADQALECLEKVERNYYKADGEPGWIFSLTQEDKPASTLRDLYAHAFILSAYAWGYDLTGEAHYLTIARQTIKDIEVVFAADPDGYLTDVPSSSTKRSQNPHMHLFEAFLALFEVSGDEFFLDYTTKILNLARRYFIEGKSGFLLEFFDRDLRPLEAFGQNRVEPGHQFEWSWLFLEYNRLVQPEGELRHELDVSSEDLLKHALALGVAKEECLIWDGLNDRGDIIDDNIRLWPYTEFLRILARKVYLEGKARYVPLMEAASSKIFSNFLKSPLCGGWIDRFDRHGRPLVDYMPASSLYHLYGAAREFVMFQEKMIIFCGDSNVQEKISRK